MRIRINVSMLLAGMLEFDTEAHAMRIVSADAYPHTVFTPEGEVSEDYMGANQVQMALAARHALTAQYHQALHAQMKEQGVEEREMDDIPDGEKN